ncbi:MAG: type II toxin-antitoxin system PrlF family antitoxin [Deltaproteobacteria bacterium]|jgi:antitoxin PrlF|nr:type II toxin-antitoxin system PrlF family antitoxin [Deltaproteobacteria bacterium]
MPAIIEIESTLTDRYQTTLPQTVRQALRLGKRDKIQYTIHPNGEVTLRRTSSSEDNDPALRSFLHFLANDITRYPERIQAVDSATVQYLTDLVGDVEFDLDSALPLDDE